MSKKSIWHPVEELDAAENCQFVESRLALIVELLQETAELLDLMLEQVSSDQDKDDLVDDIARVIDDATKEYCGTIEDIPTSIRVEFMNDNIPSWDSYVWQHSVIKGAQYIEAYRQATSVADIAGRIKARMTNQDNPLLAGSLLGDVDAAEYDGIDDWLRY